jgi:hypothetical protein
MTNDCRSALRRVLSVETAFRWMLGCAHTVKSRWKVLARSKVISSKWFKGGAQYGHRRSAPHPVRSHT